MPEGHFLHRLARDQQELVGSRPVASSPQRRFATGAAALDGQRVALIEAYGKHLRHSFGEAGDLHVHLGMQGKWLRLDARVAPRPQVRLRLTSDGTAWDLIAPSVCELVTPSGWAAIVSALGPDPLRPEADRDKAWKRIATFGGPIGAALLDQSVVAGVGNVLRAEVLFQAGIHPCRTASSIGPAEFEELWMILGRVMSQAVEDGRILTAPLHAEERATIDENEARMVYKQDRCRACGTPVETETIGGRTSYACPSHQPRP